MEDLLLLLSSFEGAGEADEPGELRLEIFPLDQLRPGGRIGLPGLSGGGGGGGGGGIRFRFHRRLEIEIG